MSEGLHVEIIAPARVLKKVEAKAVTLPGVKGYMMILPGHAAMISQLGVGELRAVDAAGKVYEYFISGGYLECGNHHIQILVDVVEQASEIDLARAQKAEDRALKRMKEAEIDFDRAQRALKRAQSRIQFAKKHRS